MPEGQFVRGLGAAVPIEDLDDLAQLGVEVPRRGFILGEGELEPSLQRTLREKGGKGFRANGSALGRPAFSRLPKSQAKNGACFVVHLAASMSRILTQGG